MKTFEGKYGFTPATDGEMQGFEYTIPDGFTAEIKDGKVIVKKQESEDERIRKWLFDKFNAKNEKFVEELDNYQGFVTRDQILAYLEKQKDQKPLMYDGEIEDAKRDIVAAIHKHYPADYAEYLTSFLKGLSPEDNSEDEYGQKMLGIAYKLMYEHIPENLRTQEFWDSLKFMREYTGKVAIIHSCEQKPAEIHIDNPNIQKFDPDVKVTTSDSSASGKELLYVSNKSYDIGFRDGVASVKPAEWSEEEDTTLCKAIDILSHKYKPYFGESEEIANRLKSLRPQPKQEWSEEDEPQKELAETYLAVFDNKFPILPTLKGKQLADYKNFLNKCQQILGLKYWGIRPLQAKLFEKLSLLWAAWGAEHLKGLGQTDGGTDNEKQEWSEEEIGHLYTLASYIKSKGYEDDGEFIEGVVNKLKSLRPQLSDEDIKKIRFEEYTKGFNDAAFGGKAWKPSEEQMESLMRTITWLVEKGNHTDSSILADLRSDLQKLM